MTAVLGDFLISAREHIALAVSWRHDLPVTAAEGTVRELSRVIRVLGSYLGDLALPDGTDQGRPQDASWQATLGTRLALRRSALVLGHAASVPGRPDGDDAHPVPLSLAAAADHLTASRDLLLACLAPGPRTTPALLAGRFYWAAVAASPPVTTALLAEITGHARTLAPEFSRGRSSSCRLRLGARRAPAPSSCGRSTKIPRRGWPRSAMARSWVTSALVTTRT